MSDIGVDLIEAFLLSRPRPHPRSYNHLRDTLARLFAWLVGQGRLEQTPVRSRPRRATYQRQPFIFDTANARRLLDLVQRLPDKGGRGGRVQRGKTYHALLAILYGLGLRVSEVCRLRVEDVEFERRLLVIRETKFYKTRRVPFGPKLETLLKAYLQLKAKHCASFAPDARLFSLRGGRAINPCTVSQTFHQLLPRLSLDIPPGCSFPRLHDLRHSFAVGALLRWYRSGADPQAHLAVQKGLRPGSIRSYRDTLRLFLCSVSEQMHKPIARLSLQDLTFDCVQDRGNHARTRNQRRAALNTFFAYLALRVPEMLATCQQVAAIPVKRTPPPATHYLEQTEMNALLHHIPRRGRHAIRDRTLLLFLYNTGARVQEAADVRVEHLVYKIVRRHGASWDTTGAEPRRVTPHLFRHTAAMLLLESGVEVNVIRGWLGHVSLDTTNRYAELTLRAKAAALRACEPACATSAAGAAVQSGRTTRPVLDWLHAL